LSRAVSAPAPALAPVPDFSPANPLVEPHDVASWVDALRVPVAITGGTGFVGSHLVDVLCGAGLRPRVLVRDRAHARWIGGAPVDWVDGDLADVAALRRLVDGAGTVLHLAGVVRAGRAVYFDRGNRVGTANLVAAVREAAPAARLVHVSSLAAAGPSPSPGGLAPTDDPKPVSAYGRSKLAAERIVASLADDGWWCVLRPPAVLGPRDTDVLEFFKMAVRGLAPVPAGERWITVAYVADVVRALLAAGANGRSRSVYHLGEPAPKRLDDLLRELATAGGCSVRVLPVPGPVIAAAGAVGSALQRLGWRRMPLTRDKTRELLASHWASQTTGSLEALGLGPGTSFEEAVSVTWRWYRNLGWLG
jgi:nucleoside-diphosphate-sugar epimerase